MVECLNEVVGAVERLNGRQVHRRRDFSRFLIVLADALTCFKTPLSCFRQHSEIAEILASLIRPPPNSKSSTTGISKYLRDSVVIQSHI